MASSMITELKIIAIFFKRRHVLMWSSLVSTYNCIYLLLQTIHVKKNANTMTTTIAIATIAMSKHASACAYAFTTNTGVLSR